MLWVGMGIHGYVHDSVHTGSSSVCLSVCLSVLSVCYHNAFVCKDKVRYHRVLENTSFKSYNVLSLPPLPTSLPDRFSTQYRDSYGFYLRRQVCILGKSTYNATDSSLLAIKL